MFLPVTFILALLSLAVGELAQTHVSCSLIGGLLSANISATCCFTAQVVTQRGLVSYGLAQACKAVWECGPDHQTPVKEFEQRALRDMCAEQGCVEQVAAAMGGNWMTSRGAGRMSGACSGPAAADAGVPGARQAAVSVQALPTPLLPQASEPKPPSPKPPPPKPAPRREPLARMMRESNTSFAIEAGAPSWGVTDLHVNGGSTFLLRRNASQRYCQRRVCNNATAFHSICQRPGDPDHACYRICCQESDFVVCFPGEAKAEVEGRGAVPMADVRPADRVLVERAPGGPLVFEPVLGFAHARRGGNAPHHFLVLAHSRGEFRASDGHIVFVVESDGRRVDKPLGRVEPGEKLVVAGADGEAAALSEVLSVRRGSGHLGMFAPLTASGSIVVDGVVASNYGWPAKNVRLPHWLAHASLAPVRAYHSLGLSHLLAPLWRRFCGGSASPNGKLKWPCGGGGLVELEPNHDDIVDEFHPFLDVIMRSHLVNLLPSG